MTARPEWLPAPLGLNPIPSNIHELLYDIFERDFTSGKPQFNGLQVWWDRRIVDTYPEGYWHIVSKTFKNDRILEPARAEKLPWCAPVITNNGTSEVTVFEADEKTYLWLEHLDYVVILGKRELAARGGKPALEVMWLITAFNIDGDSTRKKLERKRDAATRSS